MNKTNFKLKTTARVAGVLYLINAITAAIGIMVIPTKLIVPNDITLTAQNILSHEFLFRVGILCSFMSQIVFLFLGLTLYKLFENVNKQLSGTLMAFIIASVPVAFFIIFYQVSTLSILKDGFMTSFDQIQQYSLAM